jgi:hypothetical protein
MAEADILAALIKLYSTPQVAPVEIVVTQDLSKSTASQDVRQPSTSSDPHVPSH